MLFSDLLKTLLVLVSVKVLFIRLHEIQSVLYKTHRRINNLLQTTISMHHMDTDEAYWKKAWQQLHKNATSYIEQILE